MNDQTYETNICPRTQEYGRTQIKNSFSASALIRGICGQRPFLSFFAFFCGKNLLKQDCQTRPLGTRSQDRQKSRDRRKPPAATQRQEFPQKARRSHFVQSVLGNPLLFVLGSNNDLETIIGDYWRRFKNAPL
jgi:hypothetical protein